MGACHHDLPNLSAQIGLGSVDATAMDDATLRCTSRR